jgi:hypothetical protein
MGRLDCAAVLALSFAVGFAVAVRGLTLANRCDGVSLVGRVLLFLGAVAAIAAGLCVLRVICPMFSSFYAIARSGTGPDLQAVAAWWVFGIAAFRLGFLLLLGMPAALLAVSIVGMDGPPRKAAPRWLTTAGMRLSLTLGLVFTGAFAVNCASAHKFYSAIAASQPGIDPGDLGAISAATLNAQFLAGTCLLLMGVILGAVACLLSGRRERE